MNLPPGCTQADIDRAFGGVVTCAECRREFASSVEREGDWNCPRCARALARQDRENDE